MSSKAKKFIVDTSAVRAAIGHSTANHNAEFARLTADGTLWTSLYIRMEAIRLWVCAYIRMATLIDLHGSADEALVRLEQDFQIRRIKATLAVMADYARSRSDTHSPRAVAEEFGRLAVHFLIRFDRVFPARIPNGSKCRIGDYSIDRIDFNTLLKDLNELYEYFNTPITDCEVDKFLAIGKPLGRADKLLKANGVSKLHVGEHLGKYHAESTHITCTECKRLGDAIIALEQPKPYTLLATDGSYKTLCEATERDFTQMASVPAADKLADAAESTATQDDPAGL